MSKESTYISFYNKSSTVYIFKTAIRSIGSPKVIRFRVHQDGSSMLLEPYTKMELNSTFRVPKTLDDEKTYMAVHSKAFTRIISKRLGWDVGKSYRIPGTVYKGQKVIIFDLNQAVVISEDANNFS